MADILHAKRTLIARLLDGDARASKDQRRAAFENAGLDGPTASLVAKVARDAQQICDEDFAAAREMLSEDELFELVVCAAVGQASRQHDVAVAALAEATKEAADAPRHS